MGKKEFESREEMISRAGKIFNKHTRDGLEMQVVLHSLVNFTEQMEETLITFRSNFQSQARGVIERLKQAGAPDYEVHFVTQLCDNVSETLIIAGQHGEGIALVHRMRPELRELLGLDDGDMDEE
jgi:hypothetical protein